MLVILGVLAAVVVPKFTGRSEQARKTAAKTDISIARDGARRVRGRHRPLPDERRGAARAGRARRATCRTGTGPYLKRGVPNDPWGNPYVYRYPGTHNPNGYDLFSIGPDGREGNDDIDNWSHAAQ